MPAFKKILRLLVSLLLSPAVSKKITQYIKQNLSTSTKLLLVVLIVGIGLFLINSQDLIPETTNTNITVEPTPSTTPTLYSVKSVTDGDTFKIIRNNEIEIVRLVGINAPEHSASDSTTKCFAQRASEKLESLLTGKTVSLEEDIQQSNRDRYGRLLRFAKVDGTMDVGQLLIAEGYVYESLYSSKPHIYREEYLGAQKTAQEQKIGLWGELGCK